MSVGFVKVFPGITDQMVKSCADHARRALLIEGYACGTVPADDKGILEGIRYARGKGLVVFIMAGNTQGHHLEIDYGSQVDSIEAGAVFLETLAWETIDDALKLIDTTPREEVIDTLVAKYCRPDYFKRMKELTTTAILR